MQVTFTMVYAIVHSTVLPPEGRLGDLWCLPPVWTLRAVSLIPLLYYILSLLFFCLVLSLFLSYKNPFLLVAHSPDLFPWTSIFWKVGSFVWLLSFLRGVVRRWVLSLVVSLVFSKLEHMNKFWDFFRVKMLSWLIVGVPHPHVYIYARIRTRAR